MNHSRQQPPLIRIPVGTPARKCKECPAVIYMVQTKTGKWQPVRADVEGGRAPDDFPTGQLTLGETITPAVVDDPKPGWGYSHFADCPAAERFRRD